MRSLRTRRLGVDEGKVYERLAIPDKPAEDGSLNVGNAVTNDLKVLIKIARLLSVHVSPTVIFDGVVAGDISSSWTKEQWLEWLGKSIATEDGTGHRHGKFLRRDARL
ncbi:hypothetical protein UCREL1_1277 [Eutypa lata UCREL1]|uniref:Thioredoxin-like fold domain-containing protein n=1 Tax=Eutypa lata (strain UCR-EL1) TaxID=1287681 RepID=M7TYC6_EUTLA|nr:hypothetical protein UCREL1_1277 [Eutypa lata UCREL1]